MKAIKTILSIVLTAGFIFLVYYLITNKINVEIPFTKENVKINELLLPGSPFIAAGVSGIISAIMYKDFKRIFYALGADVVAYLIMISTVKVALLGDAFIIGYAVMILICYLTSIILICAGDSDSYSYGSSYGDLNNMTGNETFIDEDGSDIDVSGM